MEIKDFVKTTLKELSEAISESKQELSKNVSLSNIPLQLKGQGNNGLIEFDLAIEARDATKGGGKGGIKIAVMQASIGKDKEALSSSISRVKFTVEANFY